MTGLNERPGAQAPGIAAEAALAAYNGEQAVVAAQVRKRIPLFVGGAILAAVAALVALRLIAPDAEWTNFWHLAVYVGGVIGTVTAWETAAKPAKRLQQGLRDRILPLAFTFLDKPAYAHGVAPQSGDHLPKQAIGNFNRTTFGDVIAGSFDGVPLEIFEATYRFKANKSESISFKGVVLAFRLHRPFPGVLVAVRKTGDVSRWFRDLFGNDLETIDFINPAIGEAFEVRASNGDAARRLVDGALAKTLGFLRDTWPDGQPRLALNEDSGFVLLPTLKDFFELPKIGTPVHYAGHIAPMAHELRSLAEITRLASQIR